MIHFINYVSFHVYRALQQLYYRHVPTTSTFRNLAFSILSILIGLHKIPENNINRMFFVRDAVCYL
jgi:hypothetical protein